MHTISIAEGHYRKKGAPSIWLDGDIQEEANHWLNFDIMLSSNSPNTWKQAANSLKMWLDWCLVIGTDWRLASRNELVEWRDAQLTSVSPKTGQPYNPNTVKTRLIYVLQFLEYATGKGWYQGGIPHDGGSRPHYRPIDQDALAHTRKGIGWQGARGRNKLLPKHKQSNVLTILLREEIASLLALEGPRPSEREKTSPGSARDWLILGIPIFTGLRKEELIGLDVHQFNAIVPAPDKLYVMHDIKITGKGNKDRAVEFPVWLILDIHEYISGERKRSLLKRGNKRESQLLLGHQTHPRAGRPINKGAVENVIQRAMRAAGLVFEKPIIDPETGESDIRIVPRFSIHSLRHTYAVLAYQTYRAAGERDPWKKIQMQLGHESPKTTMDIYLRHVDKFDEGKTDFDMRRIVYG